MGIMLSGCGSVSYYTQLINGHYDLVKNEQAIEDILAEKKYDESVRKKLAIALEIREFASKELDLPDNDSYKTFVKLDRSYPVWNVIAAEKFSVKAKQWCFLIVGCINYRGYFNKQDAENKAKELAAKAYDTSVSPAAAYSTLGWFDDPLLSSMLYKEDAHLAGIIFHELAHQKVYIDNDSAFNEAFATAVELEGVRRWLLSRNDRQGMEKYRSYKLRQKQFNALLKETRARLQQLYSENSTPETIKLERKQLIIRDMKSRYQVLKKQWNGYPGYDGWMSRDINNAHLALVATYHDLVPGFEQQLKMLNYNLPAFYAHVEELGDKSLKDRHQILRATIKTEPLFATLLD